MKHIPAIIGLVDVLNTCLKCKDITEFESEDLRRRLCYLFKQILACRLKHLGQSCVIPELVSPTPQEKPPATGLGKMKDLLNLYLPVEPGLCSKERAIVVRHGVGAWWLDLRFQ